MSKCKHVIIFGMDGIGTYIRDADTPCIDKIFGDGAHTYRALVSRPTNSTECWGSFLTGTSPSSHGVTNATCMLRLSKQHSMFYYVRQAFPEASLGSFLEWEPPNYTLIEDEIGVYKRNRIYDKELVKEVSLFFKEKKPALTFIHIDKTDFRGHKFGYGTVKQYEAMTEYDGYIGEIYEAARAAGMTKENTVFLLTGDHGGCEFEHGGWCDIEKYVYFAVAGWGVQKVQLGDINLRDGAAIVLHALGIPLPPYQEGGWTGQVPKGLFADGSGDNYTPVVRLHKNFPEMLPKDKYTPSFDTKEGLRGVFGEKKPVLAMTFDEAINDEAENFMPEQCYRNGETILAQWYGSKGIRLMRGGVRGNCVLCNGDGYILVPGLRPGNKSFAAAFWLYLDDGSYVGQSGNTVFSTKKYGDLKSDGCCLMWGSDTWYFRVNTGGVEAVVTGNESKFVFPEEFDGGWVHVIASVDREQQNIRLFFGFKEVGTAPLPKKLAGKSFDGCGEFRVGMEVLRYKAVNNQYRLDDFLWFDRALSEEDVALLKQYYYFGSIKYEYSEL